MVRADNPLIVQSDQTILVEVYSPRYTEVRDLLARFAEIVRSPEHIHTYRISPLSLWNAASSGMSAAAIHQTLEEYSKYPIPANVTSEIDQQIGRYGSLRLLGGDPHMILQVDDPWIAQELAAHPKLQKYLHPHPEPKHFFVDPMHRGDLKQTLIRLGLPTEDLAGFVTGSPLAIALRETCRTTGEAFRLRDYQSEAVDVFFAGGGPQGGHGVIVLPCGAGKTIVGIGAMAYAQTQTLILATNISACRQWIREILDKTELTEAEVGEFSGEKKEIKPITVATYQILTYRHEKDGPFAHFDLFHAQNWGLILYDEVHLLPAPVFRMTSVLQARRRLGLTATLIREDGLEEDVFCLIGPKRYDVPWRSLEERGFIAEAQCHEFRVALPFGERIQYATAADRTKVRLAAENSLKIPLVQELCRRHEGDHILVIGQYLEQLRALSKALHAPLITGQTSNARREELYKAFREGKIRLLVVSKVANFSIDLPDANVLIQVSGAFGSRQEEAQRLGRILRPKEGIAHFYSLVSRDTCEQDFGLKRQLFLTEQGYRYRIEERSAEDLLTAL